jgi:hypothetical protein
MIRKQKAPRFNRNAGPFYACHVEFAKHLIAPEQVVQITIMVRLRSMIGGFIFG